MLISTIHPLLSLCFQCAKAGLVLGQKVVCCGSHLNNSLSVRSQPGALAVVLSGTGWMRQFSSVSSSACYTPTSTAGRIRPNTFGSLRHSYAKLRHAFRCGVSPVICLCTLRSRRKGLRFNVEAQLLDEINNESRAVVGQK